MGVLLVKGGLLLKLGPEHAMEGVAILSKALEMAAAMGLKMRELQIAQILGAVYQEMGRTEDAEAVMKPVVEWNRDHGDPSEDTGSHHLGSLGG